MTDNRAANDHNHRVDDDGDLRTPGGLVVPAHALAWSFTRASGPGGQHVNKTSSKASLVIRTDAVECGDPEALERMQSALGADLRVNSQASRSQWRNRQQCLEQATTLLDAAAKPPDPQRRPTKPKRGAVERRLETKRRTSEKKEARRTTEW